MQPLSATTMFKSKSRKNSFFNDTTKYLFLIKFADIDSLYIPNLSEYYEKKLQLLYICFSSLKSYKYLDPTLFEIFAGNLIEFSLLLISLIRLFQFISSVKIPSTMVFSHNYFLSCLSQSI